MASGKMFGMACAALLPTYGMAAEISHDEDADGAIIFVFGEIVAGDENKFRELSIRFPDAMVGLHSEGGAIVPAMEIGRQIRLRGYSTVVTGNSKCTSACALIWLAGSPRYLEPASSLGFHASYKDQGGRLVETGVGNALVGHYLSQLSLSDRAVIFATSASPYQISWLNEGNRTSSGIEFSMIGDRIGRAPTEKKTAGKAQSLRPLPSPPPPVYIPPPVRKSPTFEESVAQLEREEPFYAAIRQNFPAENARLRSILGQGLASGNRQKMRRDLRALITPLVNSRVSRLPAPILEKFIQLSIEQTRFMQAERPNLCSEYLDGEDIGMDTFVPPFMARREVELYDEILRAKLVPTPPKMSDEEIGSALLDPLAGMKKRLGLTFDEMVAAMSKQGPEVRHCQVAAALFEAVLSMPKENSIPLFRQLLSD